MEEKVIRMKELINILNEASYEYYKNSNPIMSDYEYDKLYDELFLLESDLNMTLSNSPTVNVEPEVISSLEQVEHVSPMLSLSKTKDISDLESFLDDKVGLLSWKLDGLTIVLTYDNGELVSGVTRGNGIIGEVVTKNVKQFKNIPLSISYKKKLVLRGEAVIRYSDFEKMNEDLDDSLKYKNPRNLCSGSVRQLDSSVTKERNVNLVIFSLINIEDKTFNLKSEEYNFLESLGFEVVDRVSVTKDNIESVVLDFKEKVKTFDIPSDGLVLTYDDKEYGNSLGTTAKFPRHSIAFKWKDETANTKLTSIDWMVSRTGLINPVAVFNPVELEGTIVSRASLHNISIMRGLKLGLGDEISVYKANMIIPQVLENLTKSNNIDIPTSCPVCREKTFIVNNGEVEYLYCMNEFCVAKLIKRLSLFVSRNAMNIDGLSDAILTKFIDEGIIKTYADLYRLNDHKETIINFEGFGEKSYDNLINSINKSKRVKLANFIYALGISDIGLSRAKLICKEYNNDFSKIRNLNVEELSNIDGLGDIIAQKWVDTFKNEEFINELEELLPHIEFTDIKNNSNNILNNKIFVITGSLEIFNNRDELVEFIENNGGKVVKAISNNVNYLINNDINSTSSKNKKAKELNINIINEEEFMQLLK